MLEQISKWKSGGAFISFGKNRYQLFVKQLGNENAPADKTLLLLHGFPESCYSYHRIVDGMLKIFDRIILFDMLGYGLSDKPAKGYPYSLLEQADSVIEVWKHFGIKGGHLLAHDMGNSVATELVARQNEGALPNWFSEGLQSLTLTNGSVVLKLASLRFMQKLLLTKIGFVFGSLLSYRVFKQQIRSAHGNDNLSEEAIRILWEGNLLKGGRKKSHLTIKYLNDRKKYEADRWIPAIENTTVPIHLCWGSDDQVARVEMAYYLKEHVCKNAGLTVMDGVGHFGQLGEPEKWVSAVGAYYIR